MLDYPFNSASDKIIFFLMRKASLPNKFILNFLLFHCVAVNSPLPYLLLVIYNWQDPTDYL